MTGDSQLINDNSILTDTDEWFATVLAKTDQMVLEGTMSEEQAAEIRGRVPFARAKLSGHGPSDWVDAFNEGCLRNIQQGTLPENEKARLVEEITDPGFNTLMRLWGQPDYMGAKAGPGEHGKYLADALSKEELQETRQRELRARETVSEMLSDADAPPMTPSEMDAFATKVGLTSADSCEKYGKRPEYPKEFLDACELQALSVGMANRHRLVELSGDDCAMQSARADAVWAKCAYPFVHIRDVKWCASLCATSMPPDLAELVRAPWGCFRVAIPQGILSIDLDGEGNPEDCTRLMAMFDANQEWTIVLYGSTRMMHITGEKTGQLCEDVDVAKRNIAHDPGLALSRRDGRVMRLAARLVLAICVSLDRRSEWPDPTIRRYGIKNRRGAQDPTVRQYVLRPPLRVNVDARAALRSYVAGTKKGAAPSVQVLVRGHWKNQPCGTGRSERKFIHIEPYWRGPEDAPIAVRPHILKNGKKPGGNDEQN